MQRITGMMLALVAFTGCAWEDTGAGADTGTLTEAELWPDLGNQPSFDDGVWLYGHVVSPSTTIGVAGAIVGTEVNGESVWTVSLDEGRFRLQLPAGSWPLSVQKGRYTGGAVVDLDQDTHDYHLVLDPGDVEVAVVIGEYDDVGHLIGDLGIPTTAYPTVSSVIGDAATLASTDVIFLNCGTDRGTGNGYSDADGQVLRAWVEAGGTLYASDWEWQAFARTAPDGLSFGSNPLTGTAGYVDAAVRDRGLQTLLGADTATLAFDLGQWAVPSGPGTAEVLVEGVPPGSGSSRPLAAMARLGEGRLIFTSFHNDAQATDDMELILYEMILSL